MFALPFHGGLLAVCLLSAGAAALVAPVSPFGSSPPALAAGDVIPASPGGVDLPASLVVGFDLEGEWRLIPQLGFVDEYVPTGKGPHGVSVEILGEKAPRLYEIESGGQAYFVFGSLTVNPTHRDEIVAFERSQTPERALFSGTTYPPGSSAERSGSCWTLIGIGLDGCRLYNCRAGGDGCALDVTAPGGGGGSHGSETSCVESGFFDPLATICPDGSITVCMP